MYKITKTKLSCPHNNDDDRDDDDNQRIASNFPVCKQHKLKKEYLKDKNRKRTKTWASITNHPKKKPKLFLKHVQSAAHIFAP